jgi:hypothetical protein
MEDGGGWNVKNPSKLRYVWHGGSRCKNDARMLTKLIDSQVTAAILGKRYVISTGNISQPFQNAPDKRLVL